MCLFLDIFYFSTYPILKLNQDIKPDNIIVDKLFISENIILKLNKSANT